MAQPQKARVPWESLASNAIPAAKLAITFLMTFILNSNCSFIYHQGIGIGGNIWLQDSNAYFSFRMIPIGENMVQADKVEVIHMDGKVPDSDDVIASLPRDRECFLLIGG